MKSRPAFISAIALVTVSATAFMLAPLPSGGAVEPDSKPVREPHKVVKRERLTAGGETKITVIRDATTGVLLLKAATDPSTNIDFNPPEEYDVPAELLDVPPGPESKSPLRQSVDDQNGLFVVSAETTVASQAEAEAREAALTDATLASRYAAIGWAPRVGGSGGIFDGECLIMGGSEAYWRGCFLRYTVRDSDPNHWYILDSVEAEGHHEGAVGGIDHATVALRYFRSAAGTQIMKRKPGRGVEIPGDNCRTQNATLTAAPWGIGAEASFEYRKCDSVSYEHGDEDSTWVTWDGWKSNDSSIFGAGGSALVQMPRDGANSGSMLLRIDEDEFNDRTL